MKNQLQIIKDVLANHTAYSFADEKLSAVKKGVSERNELPKWVKVVKSDSFKWYKDRIGEVFEIVSEGVFESGDEYYTVKCGRLVIYKNDCTPCDAPNEVNTELPKVGEVWECVENLMHSGSMRFNKGKIYKSEINGTLLCELGNNFYIIRGIDYRSHFRKVSQSNEVERMPIAYKLNVLCFEHDKGDIITIEEYKSAHDRIFIPQYEKPSYTVLLSNGQEVELTDEDIENIKKMK